MAVTRLVQCLCLIRRLMDLNRARAEELPISFSLVNIHFVTRPKTTSREGLVCKYGKEGYNALVASTKLFVFVTFARARIVIFILT